MDMNIYYYCIGWMNPEDNKFYLQDRKKSDEVKKYIRELLEHTVNNRRTRTYVMDEEGEMSEIIRAFANAEHDPLEAQNDANLDDLAGRIGSRLVAAESSMHKQKPVRDKRIRTGSFVLSLLRNSEGKLCFIIAKVNHELFLEGQNLEEHVGIPLDSKDIWMTAVVMISETPKVTVEEVHVYMDRPAKYWTDVFLEVKEKRDNRTNSKLMYQEVRGILKKNVEPVSANDFLILWNALVQRMRKETHLDYGEFVDELLDDYRPQEKELDTSFLKTLKNQLAALPDDRGFDRKFTVDSTDIARMLKSEKLSIAEGIELTISERVKEPQKWITSFRDSEGIRYIRIRCTDSNAFEKFDN
ncbi:MAG: hypothetical protein Q4A32_06750 [Lachnospiraceae bacterium]|nr:hypothetical protein [Lachnospiraceae bacterium]